jgi:hypothetical protein
MNVYNINSLDRVALGVDVGEAAELRRAGVSEGDIVSVYFVMM